MKKITFFVLGLIFTTIVFSQTPAFDSTITINQTFSTHSEIFPFTGYQMYGVGINGTITFNSDTAIVKIVLRDSLSVDYLVFESNSYLESRPSFTFNEECEETCFLDGFVPTSIEIQILNASLTIYNLKWCSTYILDATSLQDQARGSKVSQKISQIQNYITNHQLIWAADETAFTKMYYNDKKEHYKCCIWNPAIEYYVSGVFSLKNPPPNIEINYDFADNFDWRNRHGSSWLTSAKCQDGCWIDGIVDCTIDDDDCTDWRGAPTCWTFGPTSHVEALVNLYLNQHIDVDLAEQNIVSCSYGGSPHITAGSVTKAYDYFISTGVVDEECFPYTAEGTPCENKCPSLANPNSPLELVSISDYDQMNPSQEVLRQIIMEHGPVSATAMNCLWGNWTHSMQLVGWDVIEWGDENILGVPSNTHPWFINYVGCTYWIYKNSYGIHDDMNGFQYMIHENDEVPNIFVIPTDVPNFVSSNLNTFSQSDVQCEDNDNDGYFNWGIGPKPPYPQCPNCPDEPDGDDNNPGLGPIDDHGFCTIIDTYNSDFETSMNFWKQTADDECDWYKYYGETPSYPATGPNGTPDGSDFYIYIDASICYLNSGAILESPPIDLSDACAIEVTFAYHKNNYVPPGVPIEDDDSKLAIDISYNGGQDWIDDYWLIIGDQEDQWHYVTVLLPSDVNKFRFNTNTGGIGFQNDMALDDITIAPATGGDIWISTDETWDQANHYICGNIYIQANATLTITDEANVLMNENKKIVVKRGGKLVIDNATITSATEDFWQGIEVWGNSNSPQYPTTQGWVKTQNGSIIENSVMGIYTNKPDPDPIKSGWVANYTGGIVQVSNTIFTNNTVAIQFYPYSYSSVSYINNCEIEVDGYYGGNDEPANFVYISGMNGVDILNTLFDNNTSIIHKYRGVYSINSSVYISGDPNFMCSSTNSGKFEKLEYGVYATSTSTTKHVTVVKTMFDQVKRSIYISGMTAPRITENCFKFKTSSTYECYGLYLNESTGYWVEGNRFWALSSSTSTCDIGIVVNNSEREANEIYRNEFINLEFGILAQGENRDGKGVGLELRCNTYDDTDMDEVITHTSDLLTPYLGISSSQGYFDQQTPLAEHMAGNLFQDNGPPYFDDYDDLDNEGNDFTYYYPENAPDFTNVEPKDFTDNTITDEAVNFLPNWTYDDGCPDNINTGGGTGRDSESEKAAISSANQDIASTEATINALLDGGDTEQLNSEVELSTTPEATLVYNEVMSEAPYVSETVMESAIEKDDVLPNAMVRDIMVANPHSAKDNNLVTKLDERVQPMPAYMKGQILQGKELVSAKEKLMSELAYHKGRKAKAMNYLTWYYLTDSINPDPSVDSLLLIYQNDNAIGSKYRLAFLYLDKGEYQNGSNTLSSIGSTFDLQGDELIYHEDMVSYFNILKDIRQSDVTIADPTDEQILALENLEGSINGKTWAYARNILLGLDLVEYDEPIILPDHTKSSEAYAEYQELVNTKPRKQLEISPNPSDDFVVVSYTLDILKSGYSIQLADINGNSMKTINVENKQDQVIVNTREWKPGTYIATLYYNGSLIESIKFTIL